MNRIKHSPDTLQAVVDVLERQAKVINDKKQTLTITAFKLLERRYYLKFSHCELSELQRINESLRKVSLHKYNNSTALFKNKRSKDVLAKKLYDFNVTCFDSSTPDFIPILQSLDEKLTACMHSIAYRTEEFEQDMGNLMEDHFIITYFLVPILINVLTSLMMRRNDECRKHKKERKKKTYTKRQMPAIQVSTAMYVLRDEKGQVYMTPSTTSKKSFTTH